MQTNADGPDFGPITTKLIQDLLSAGVRLTTQVHDRPDQLTSKLQAYTVEMTTALAVAIGKLESTYAGTLEEPRRVVNSRHLKVVPEH